MLGFFPRVSLTQILDSLSHLQIFINFGDGHIEILLPRALDYFIFGRYVHLSLALHFGVLEIALIDPAVVPCEGSLPLQPIIDEPAVIRALLHQIQPLTVFLPRLERALEHHQIALDDAALAVHESALELALILLPMGPSIGARTLLDAVAELAYVVRPIRVQLLPVARGHPVEETPHKPDPVAAVAERAEALEHGSAEPALVAGPVTEDIDAMAIGIALREASRIEGPIPKVRNALSLGQAPSEASLVGGPDLTYHIDLLVQAGQPGLIAFLH